jgi:hypothetical protein
MRWCVRPIARTGADVLVREKTFGVHLMMESNVMRGCNRGVRQPAAAVRRAQPAARGPEPSLPQRAAATTAAAGCRTPRLDRSAQLVQGAPLCTTNVRFRARCRYSSARRSRSPLALAYPPPLRRTHRPRRLPINTLTRNSRCAKRAMRGVGARFLRERVVRFATPSMAPTDAWGRISSRLGISCRGVI